MSIDRFWMIYGVGQNSPSVRHKTFASAEGEAKRLARKNPGVEFYILATCARARKVDVEFDVADDYSGNDGIPF